MDERCDGKQRERKKKRKGKKRSDASKGIRFLEETLNVSVIVESDILRRSEKKGRSGQVSERSFISRKQSREEGKAHVVTGSSGESRKGLNVSAKRVEESSSGSELDVSDGKGES